MRFVYFVCFDQIFEKLFFKGGSQVVNNHDDPNGFYVTPDGLYIPQQYVYYTPEPQFPAGQQPGTQPVDVAVLKDLIKKQV